MAMAMGAVRIWTSHPPTPNATNSLTEVVAVSVEFRLVEAVPCGTTSGRNDRSATSKNVVRMAAPNGDHKELGQREHAEDGRDRDRRPGGRRARGPPRSSPGGVAAGPPTRRR